MQDLNANMFYRAKFIIQPTSNEENDLLWMLILKIHAWITSKLNRKGCPKIIEASLRSWTDFKKGSKFYDLGLLNRIYAESVYHEATDDPARISWACKIVEKPEVKNGYAPREWVTEIGYQSFSKNSAEISYVLTYSDQTGFIGPLQLPPQSSIPSVVKNILKDSKIFCSIGPDHLPSEPIKLGPGDFPAFEKKLFNPDREVPIIYLSPRRISTESQIAKPLVDPLKLAENVTANAIVYYSESLDFTQEMNYLGNCDYLCSGGAIRIYRPHINTNDESDPKHHRFLSAQFIDENGEEKVIDIFRRAIAQDVHFYESLFRVNNCRALIESDRRRANIAQIKSHSKKEIEAAEQLVNDAADKLEHERVELDRKIIELKDENEQLRREIYNSNAKIETLQERAEKYQEIKSAADNIRRINEYPNTPQTIAKYFETVYPERIAFTENARRSMNECTTKSEILWEAFYHIAVDLYDLLKKAPATAFQEFKNSTGWVCSRGEGPSTHANAKNMRQRIDTYNGQEIDIEPHVKNGVSESDSRFVRIYFAYDPSVADKIIIGHCGKHLDNFSTRKARR